MGNRATSGRGGGEDAAPPAAAAAAAPVDDVATVQPLRSTAGAGGLNDRGWVAAHAQQTGKSGNRRRKKYSVANTDLDVQDGFELTLDDEDDAAAAAAGAGSEAFCSSGAGDEMRRWGDPYRKGSGASGLFGVAGSSSDNRSGGSGGFFSPTTVEGTAAAHADPSPHAGTALLPPFAVHWHRGELLGSGAFGMVYLGLDADTGELFAAKQVPLVGLRDADKVRVPRF